MPLRLAWRHVLSVHALLSLLTLPHVSSAQSQETTVTNPPRQNLEAAARQDDQKPPAVRFEMKAHPTLVLGPVELALRARFQLDRRQTEFDVSDEDASALDAARKRIGVEGTIGNVAEFQIEREFADKDDPWRDVFVNYRQFDAVQVQFGKFKLPFGLEENVSSTNLDFATRSLMSRALAPGRDRGVMVHGRFAGRVLKYEVGTFDHDGSNAKSTTGARVTGGRTKVARLSAQPLRFMKGPADVLEVGAAWTSSDVAEGHSSIQGETALGAEYFESDYPIVGERARRSLEARWQPGPVSVQAEFMRLTEERLGLSVEDTDLPRIRARGWYLSGTWAVTGDSKVAGLDATEHPIGRGGVGAIEIAARIEQLRFDSDATGETPSRSPRANVIVGNSNRALTFGVNWYLNRWIKVQLNLIKETLSDPTQGPMPSQPTFTGRIFRVQFTI